MGISKSEDVGGGRSTQEGTETSYCSSRMLKKSASGVLASLPGTVKRGSAAELLACLGHGASRRARGGRGRSLVFLSIL